MTSLPYCPHAPDMFVSRFPLKNPIKDAVYLDVKGNLLVPGSNLSIENFGYCIGRYQDKINGVDVLSPYVLYCFPPKKKRLRKLKVENQAIYSTFSLDFRVKFPCVLIKFCIILYPRSVVGTHSVLSTQID